MREAIADAASRLFAERGFDDVTVDDIAAAADVGRKTVFNHFPRKEDLFFDRDEDIRRLLGDAVQRRDVAPIESLRRLAHTLADAQSPYVESSAEAVAFMETIAASDALKDRARSMGGELAEFVAQALARRAGRDVTDPDAFLAANMTLTTWVTARVLAHRAFLRHRDAAEARTTFLGVIDRGHQGVHAAMIGTPYG